MKLRKTTCHLFSSRPMTPPPHKYTNKSMASIKELHAHLIRNQLHTDPSSISDVFRSYSLNPAKLHQTFAVFNQIQEPTTSNWNSMIRAISLSNQPIEAIPTYSQMRVQGVFPDHLTFIFIFKACARVPEILHGRMIHLQSLKFGLDSHLFVSNALIHMFGSHGQMGFAQKVFDEISEKDLVSWNSLICGYSQSNRFKEVLRLFEAMQAENVKADAVTMVKIVLACSHLGDQEFADSVVKYIEENNVEVDVYLGNTLIDLYGRRGSVEPARNVFDQIYVKNMVSWNTMIIGYAKAGDLGTARKLFDCMPTRDVISWTSMITGYSQTNRFTDALSLFREMMKAKVKPDEITLATVLSACAHTGSLDLGKEIHDYIGKYDIKADLHVMNSLIDMYCKCGCIENALEVFHNMKEKDTVSWGSVILGLGINGHAHDAIKLFLQMLREGVQPSDVTFMGVLLGCSHAGLVDEGLKYFESMAKVHRIEPKMKHYGCVVDLLSRSGNLVKAHEFIENMPLTPDPVLWRILLSASKLYGNVDMAEIALKKVLELESGNSGSYVLLSNTYSGTNRWDDAANIRMLMKEKMCRKHLAVAQLKLVAEYLKPCLIWFSWIMAEI